MPSCTNSISIVAATDAAEADAEVMQEEPEEAGGVQAFLEVPGSRPHARAESTESGDDGGGPAPGSPPGKMSRISPTSPQDVETEHDGIPSISAHRCITSGPA